MRRSMGELILRKTSDKNVKMQKHVLKCDKSIGILKRK